MWEHIAATPKAPLIRIRDISYDQRNAISRTSPRPTKWRFANPPQLLIAATNITGHKWLHPHTQTWLMKHRRRLSVLFTLVYHSGIKMHLWKCDPATVIRFTMIYVWTVRGKYGKTSSIDRQSNIYFFSSASILPTDCVMSLINVQPYTSSSKGSVCVLETQERSAV